MCGIAGIYNFSSGSVSESETQAMADSLAHRGPNGEGIWCKGPVGLAHRRLAIFDLSSAGAQPMATPDGRYWIVYNGEIYNWPEIRKDLRFDAWVSQTDTETILHAYAERGPDCLRLFNGMFAMAIYDARERTLFLARDRVGIKPLLYGVHNDRFLFASEAKAMFTAGFPKEPDMEMVYDFLRWGLIDHHSRTFFKGVVSLPPGHHLSIGPEGVGSSVPYWDLPSIVDAGPTVDLPGIVDEYAALQEDAIDLRLRSDVPVGVFLSGGVDSSILAARLAAKCSGRLEAYTYDFDTGDAGERVFAKEVADWLGLEHKVSVLSHSEVPEAFMKMLHYEEQPVTSMRVLAAHKLYEESGREGSTVVLEGHGGDHVGAGFEYYFMAHIMDLVMREGARPAFEALMSYLDMYNVPENYRLKKLFWTMASIHRIGAATQDGVPFTKAECLDPDFAASSDTSRVDLPHPFRTYLLNQMYIDTFHHNLPRVLRYADRASMSVGREARVPILDHRVVELGFRSSEAARTKDGKQRYFMRQAAKGFLPEYILNRPKRSVVDPQRRWLQHELRQWVRDIFSSKSFRERGVFNADMVSQEYERYVTEEKPETSFHIFQYVNVELWFRAWIDASA